MTSPVVLSHYQARTLLNDRKTGRLEVSVSPDLEITQVAVTLDESQVFFPSGERLPWQAVEKIVSDENACFALLDGELHRIQAFSEVTNRAYSLYPTSGAPTLLVSGLPMHRIKGTDPQRDTRAKIKAARPVVGRVLDTATGLGYTAILAAQTAQEVITVELDPLVLEIARQNPWSQQLFAHPRIRQEIGDVAEVIESFADNSFTLILHDPPMMSLAGHLYGRAFYGELFRVLRAGGKLFHYIGDPESHSGRNLTRGVIQRLQAVGFERLSRQPQAFGVTAFKPGYR